MTSNLYEYNFCEDVQRRTNFHQCYEKLFCNGVAAEQKSVSADICRCQVKFGSMVTLDAGEKVGQSHHALSDLPSCVARRAFSHNLTMK